MIQRRALECLTCGKKIAVRTAIGHSDYQEFAFPCSGCGVEIRYGMKLLLEKRMKRIMSIKDEHLRKRGIERLSKMQHIKYVNLHNLKWLKTAEGITDVKTLDGETLNPVSDEHFSP